MPFLSNFEKIQYFRNLDGILMAFFASISIFFLHLTATIKNRKICYREIKKYDYSEYSLGIAYEFFFV